VSPSGHDRGSSDPCTSPSLRRDQAAPTMFRKCYSKAQWWSGTQYDKLI